jgi:hypothetical protein
VRRATLPVTTGKTCGSRKDGNDQPTGETNMDTMQGTFCPIYTIVPSNWDTYYAFMVARGTGRELYQRGPNGHRVMSSVPVIGYQKIIMGEMREVAA